MNKPEIQALQAFVFGVCEIVRLLLFGHRIPNDVSLLVSEDVILLGEEEKDDVERGDGHQNLVSAAVEGLVVVAVNVAGNDISSLHRPFANLEPLDTNVVLKFLCFDQNLHIVDRGRDSAGLDGV